MLSLTLVTCLLSHPACTAPPPLQSLRVEVLRELPHDPGAFTQGLIWHDGSLYESTGGYGQSSLRRLSPESGTLELRRDLPDTLFGEGLARIGDRLIQLTWKAGLALVYDLDSLELLERRRYVGEGWGLCLDDGELVMSDGSSWLVRRAPETFRELNRFQVTLEGVPVEQVNELECAEGWIYANLWLQDQLVRIDPRTGEVVARIDASELRRRLGSRIRAEDALNGIAFQPATATFFLTGKNWPIMFEVIFVE